MVKLLSNLNTYDLRTTYGQNLKNISKSCNIVISELKPWKVKEHMKYKEMEEVEKWRLPIIKDLLLAKKGQLIIPNFDSKDIDILLRCVCSS